MAIKSNNQQGNPYHDEATGQFTKKDGGGSSLTNEQQEEHQAMKMFGLVKAPMKLGTIDDIKAWREQKQQEKQNTPEIENENKGFKKAKNISEAIDLANDFVKNKTHIVWAKDTNLDAANEMNEALYDVYQDFPEIFNHLINITNTNAGINVDDERRKTLEKLETLTKTLNLDEEAKKILEDEIKNSLDFEEQSKSKLPTGETGGFYEGVAVNNKMLYSCIRLNRKDTVDKINFDLKYAFNVISGHSMAGKKGANYSNLVHELGHATHYNLENFMSSEEKEFIRNKYYDVAFPNSVGTSDYGRTSYHEFVSEAFIDYYGNNKQPKHKISGEIVNFIKKMYSKYLT